MKMLMCAKVINGMAQSNLNLFQSNLNYLTITFHFRTLASLWSYLHDRGVDVEAIKTSLKDIVIKTLLSVTPLLTDMIKNNVSSRYSCYELFGFDVLLDSDLKPWLLEVNISPSLHSTSSLDLSVKVCLSIHGKLEYLKT